MKTNHLLPIYQDTATADMYDDHIRTLGTYWSAMPVLCRHKEPSKAIFHFGLSITSVSPGGLSVSRRARGMASAVTWRAACWRKNAAEFFVKL